MRAAVARALEKRRSALVFRDHQEKLEQLQSELADRHMREELARTKGEIYASVLHDINSPLTVISGFVELINRSMQDAARRAVREFVTRGQHRDRRSRPEADPP